MNRAVGCMANGISQVPLSRSTRTVHLVLEFPLLRSSYPGCISVGLTVAACNIAELLTMNANANANTSHSLMPD